MSVAIEAFAIIAGIDLLLMVRTALSPNARIGDNVGVESGKKAQYL